MPWKVDPVPEQRTALVHTVRAAGLSVAEAARRYGVSRQTAHKWLARFDKDPSRPLADRSRRPVSCPRRTADDTESAVLEARDRYGWGPRMLRAVLAREGRPPAPARTVAAILARHGRTRPAPPPGPPPRRFERPRPNELWQLDFKGPVEVARRRHAPLSVLGDHSRYLLCLRPCADMTFATVEAALRDLFGDVGMPEQVLCDNAFSTAKNSCVGLTSFEAWRIRLGIRPAHGRPFHPQTQGKVERLHGTLEAELWPRALRPSTSRPTWRHSGRSTTRCGRTRACGNEPRALPLGGGPAPRYDALSPAPGVNHVAAPDVNNVTALHRSPTSATKREGPPAVRRRAP